MEIDNIEIEKLTFVLNSDTTLSRFSALIEKKEVIIAALLKRNIQTSEKFFEQYNFGTELLENSTKISKEILECLAVFFTFYKYKNRKIKEFTSIGLDNITKLNKYGIFSSKELLYKCNTPDKRMHISCDTGISEYILEKAVCVFDIARLPGIKDIRASLYYDCGFISMKNIAMQEPKEFIDKVSKFIKVNNIDKTPPLNKEISTQIAWAKVYNELIKL